MPIPEAPKLVKWPFLLGDALLVAFACFILKTASWPLSRWEIAAVAPCFGIGAWLAILPFLREHKAAVKLWEQTNLVEAAQQLDQLVTVANQISAATTHWQSVQDSAAKTVAASDELARRMAGETKGFAEFFQRAEAQEKAAMRLEIDKLRRGEGESLQVIVHLLDHVYALFLASVRTGQPQLTQQLGQFRAACLDTVRRLGVVAHEAMPGEDFDPKAHQTPDGQEPAAGSKVAGTIACGYTYQGQPVRRILVAVAKAGDAAALPPERVATTPSIDEQPT
jgi:molecular chaperone GrpE (heat shock protein)